MTLDIIIMTPDAKSHLTHRSVSEVGLLDWSLDSASLSGGLWENPNLTVRAPAHGTGGGAGLTLDGGAGDTHHHQHFLRAESNEQSLH